MRNRVLVGLLAVVLCAPVTALAYIAGEAPDEASSAGVQSYIEVLEQEQRQLVYIALALIGAVLFVICVAHCLDYLAKKRAKVVGLVLALSLVSSSAWAQIDFMFGSQTSTTWTSRDTNVLEMIVLTVACALVVGVISRARQKK